MSIRSDTGKFAMVPEWVLEGLGKDIRALQLYCHLSLLCDFGDEGDFVVDQEALGARLGISVDTLQRAMVVLEALGALQKQRTGRASIYTLIRARYRTHAESHSAPVPDHTTLKENTQERAIEPPPTGFETFWASYPRRLNRKGAERSWGKLSPDARDAALAALPAFVARCKGVDLAFVPHPTTWLNQKRWEDPALVGKQTEETPWWETDTEGWVR